METFEVQVGPQQRKLTIEPIQNDNLAGGKTYKLFLNDQDGEWLSNPENEETREVPVTNYLGVITVKSDKQFTFDGQGELSGNDLLAIAAQITRHPSFDQQQA